MKVCGICGRKIKRYEKMASYQERHAHEKCMMNMKAENQANISPEGKKS